jgi:hypothetical protein
MTFDPRWSIAAINGALNTRLANLNGGTVVYYTGTKPATPDTALAGNTPLVTLTLSATAFASASGGIGTANTVTAGTAVNTGVATWARCYNSSGAAVFDGSVGVTGGSFDFTLPSTTITYGQVVPLTPWTIQETQ